MTDVIKREASSLKLPLFSEDFAKAMDANDPLKHLRNDFCMPRKRRRHHSNDNNTATSEQSMTDSDPDSESELVYLCGNSLGLLPKESRRLVNQEFDVWADRGVDGHFDHPFGRPWVTVDEEVVAKSATIVGAKPSEVAIMNSLTANLHFLMVRTTNSKSIGSQSFRLFSLNQTFYTIALRPQISFYVPTKTRYKILVEDKAFPSDRVRIASLLFPTSSYFRI